MENGGTLKYRVEQLEKDQERINGKLDLIMSNHLPHIQAEVERVRTELKVQNVNMKVLTVINLGALIVAILVSKYIG